MMTPEEAAAEWDSSAQLVEYAPTNADIRADYTRATMRPGPQAPTYAPLACPVCDLLPSGAHWTGCPVGESQRRGQR